MSLWTAITEFKPSLATCSIGYLNDTRSPELDSVYSQGQSLKAEFSIFRSIYNPAAEITVLALILAALNQWLPPYVFKLKTIF